MTSQKNMQNQTENTSKVQMKKWMRIVLSILLAVVLLFIVVVSVININQSRVGTSGVYALPKLPFSANSYVLSLKHEVKGTKYKSGTLLIIDNEDKFNNGDVVLFQNVFADRIDEAILRKYLIGVIDRVDDIEISVSIPSYENETVKVVKENILGKVSNDARGLGFIYSKMIGISGIMMFAVIPALFWVLIFFVMHYLTLSAKCRDENVGLNVVSAKTIRSKTIPLAKIYASGKSELDSALDKAEQNVKVFVPQKAKPEKKRIIVHKDEEIPPVSVESIDDRPRAVIEKIKQADNDAVIKDIKLNNERLNEMDSNNSNNSKDEETHDKMKNDIDLSSTLEFVIEMSADGQPIDPAMVKTEDENVEEIQDSKKTDDKDLRVLKKVLSADEILDIYRREGKLDWANTDHQSTISDDNDKKSQKVAAQNEENIETMARLYYDNEIDNYE